MTSSRSLGVSVVVTVLNEVESIGRLLDSLAVQTRVPDEVVVVDGGSTDGTWSQLQARAADDGLRLRILSRPGSNISAGRNTAIQAASGPVIACTDAGVRLEPTWLAAVTAPIDAGARFVGGFFVADPAGAFETALGAATLPEAREVDERRFLPSSRSVAYTRQAWRECGGYPEWLDYGEDLVFDFGMIAVVGRPAFEPGALVHYRPRASLRAFLRQYFRYARGDGKADLWPVRHLIRYVTYLAVAPGLLFLTVTRHWAWAFLLLAGLGIMLRRPYGRLRRQWSGLPWTGRLQAALLVPVVRIAGDTAKMAGYPVGLAWRWRHRPPAWRPTPEVGRL